MMHLNTVSKEYAGRYVLREVDWRLNKGQRVALVGENGAGKTTLLRIIAGEEDPSAGTVRMAKGAVVGYLPQDIVASSQRRLFDEALSAFEDLKDIERELQELSERIPSGDPDALQSSLDRLGRLQEEFRLKGGYSMEAETARVLHGLGFSNNDFDRFCSEFSGGWRMRIALAKLLLRKPQILLLDEPTNHLDLESRNWLEEYLKSYPFSVIMVSHDRFFMDQVCHRITEVWNSTLTDYHCNYSNYLVQRDERVARLREAKARQDEEIARMEDFISRFRYKADKASLVQSRVKQLEKIDRIVLPPERKKINFRFPDAPKSGKITLELKRATRSYGENIVLDQIDLVIERGEKIALVGPNGAGKSTLIRTLAGIDTLDRGERRVGHNVISDYFAQDQSVSLQGQNSVYDEILADAPFEMVPELRNILGTFLFSGDDVNKKVSVLSGGEKNRLALAKMLMRPLNLLLLDEPTNHLDLFSKEVLLRALRSFSGTVIFVSHDRFFIDSLATRVVEVGNRKVRSFIGNYEDYLQKTGQDTAVADVRSVPLVDASGDASVAKVAKEVRLLRREEQRERQKQERIREKRIAEIESEIDLKERELAELEARMGEPGFFRDPDAAKNTAQEHELLSGTLMGLYGEWEELSGSSVDEKPHPALTESV